MNIKTEKVIGAGKPLQPLFESNQIQNGIPVNGMVDIKQQQQIETVFSVKSKQFNFDCGIVMGSLNSKVNEIKFGLSYHDEHTANFEDFVGSVTNFLIGIGMQLTDADKNRLMNHYRRFSIHKNTLKNG